MSPEKHMYRVMGNRWESRRTVGDKSSLLPKGWGRHLKKYIINLTKDDYINLVNICVGFYSPLKGFCDYRDYCSIIEKNKINNNINWTIPILLNSSLSILTISCICSLKSLCLCIE